ncbi:G protein-coupled glucose receptor regulating Gpa2-domain-containing protein [Amanita rubescens]|nr:G protein-coupled glucose receptor regulating Gpa2-domain-containing protein [Amanita rubescens]
MTQASKVEIAIAAVTACASLMSLVGSALILVCYAILPFDRHFRHVLILNLATSDFLHSLNNVVPDLHIVSHKKDLARSPACVFNGFATQVTVQATDCAVLAITITTVYAITKRATISSMSGGRWEWRWIVLLTCSIWILPIFTGFLGLAMEWYSPVSGSWCWLEAKPVYLRYVLMHGWRFLFIFIEIGLFIYLDIHLRRHYRMVSESISSRNMASRIAFDEPRRESAMRPPVGGFSMHVLNAGEKLGGAHDRYAASPSEASNVGLIEQNKSRRVFHWFSRISGLRGTSQTASSFSSDTQHQAVQRALLLNAYPLAYIILWIPALANRLIEATGSSSIPMQFLQVTAQLIGLANALTYGWNEKVAELLKEKFASR